MLPPGEGRVRCEVTVEEGELVVHLRREPFDVPQAAPRPGPALQPGGDPLVSDVSHFLQHPADFEEDGPLVRPRGWAGTAIALILGRSIGRPFTMSQLAAQLYPEKLAAVRQLGNGAVRAVMANLGGRISDAAGGFETRRRLAARRLYAQKGTAQRADVEGRPSIIVYRAIPTGLPDPTRPSSYGDGRLAIKWRPPLLPPAKYR